MSDFVLIIAAHGSNNDASVNARVHDLAVRSAALSGFSRGLSAFHQGAPAFSSVLDESDSEYAVVVPLMTSGGFYCETVLPREIVKNQRYGHMMVHKTRPVGTHPAMIPLIEARAVRLLAEHGVSPGDTSLALIGHGTEHHAQSRVATEVLARAMQERDRFTQVITAFLDEEPPVESIAERVTAQHLVVEPFLISDAYHALVDVPRRLGLTPATASNERVVGQVGKRLVICDTAVGTDDAILGVIIALAVHGRGVLTQRIAGAA